MVAAPFVESPLRLRPLLVSFATAAALFGLVPGCGAGNGGVCQINTDCASGLVCCGASASLRGVCRAVTEGCTVAPVDAGPIDGGPDAPIDAPPLDAPVPVDAPDALMSDVPELVDAPMDAPALVDDAGSDAGPIDDAGSEADAGTDAP